MLGKHNQVENEKKKINLYLLLEYTQVFTLPGGFVSMRLLQPFWSACYVNLDLAQTAHVLQGYYNTLIEENYMYKYEEMNKKNYKYSFKRR